MNPASFALEHIFYPEVAVKANPEYLRDSENPPAKPQIKISVYKVEENRFQIAMEFTQEIESESDAYDLRAHAFATFLTDPEEAEELQTKVVAQSGPNIVYGALREHFATITARAPWKEYYLPAVISGQEDFFVPESEEEAKAE